MTRTCVLPLLFALAVSGCIHHRTGMIESTASQNMEWRTGVTTRRDVVAAWGNPHKMAEIRGDRPRKSLIFRKIWLYPLRFRTEYETIMPLLRN